MSAAENEIVAPAGFADGSAFTPDVPAAADPVAPVIPDDDAPAVPVAEVPVVSAEPAPAAVPPAPVQQTAEELQAEISKLTRARDAFLHETRQERADRRAAEARVAALEVQNQELLRSMRPAPAVPTPRSGADVAKLTNYANTWGLWTPEGQPDVDRAESILNDLRADVAGNVEARVTERMQPVTQVLQNAHVAAKRAEILQVAAQVGSDVGMLNQMLDSADPASLDTPEIVVHFLGITHPGGLKGLQQRVQGGQAPPPQTPAAPAAPVVVQPNLTERVTRPNAGPPPLSRIEQSVASKRGMSQAKWNETAKGFAGMDPHRGLVVDD